MTVKGEIDVKKVLALVAGAAALAGAVWYLNKKKNETTVLYSEEFDGALDISDIAEEDVQESTDEEATQ